MKGSEEVRRGLRQRLAAMLAIALVAFAASCMTGCRISDALTEVVYDQSADIIDYDNPTKIWINDSTAEEESDQFSAKEVSDDTDVVSDVVQNLVVYSSNPNTQGFTAKKSVFSATPDFRGIEASEEVNFVRSDDPDAFDHPLTVEEPEDEPDEPEEEPEQVVAAETPTESNETEAPAPTGVGDQKTDQGQGDNDGWEPVAGPDEGEGDGDGGGDATASSGSTAPEDTEDGGGGGGGDNKVPYDANDPTQEPPKVDSIAAFGQAAVIVQMIGGEGALAAADQDLLDSRFSTMPGTSGVKVGWSGDGTDPSQMDIDAIVDSGAQLVLAYQGSYFSEDVVQALKEKGVQTGTLYAMSCSEYIKNDVDVVGRMLSESTSIQYAGQTQQRSADYASSYHDKTVIDAANATGGLAGFDIYQMGGDSAVPGFTSGDSVYTLLIDQYDPYASYTGSDRGGWRPTDGLAVAKSGCATTPVSYYLQAGGVVNTAAQRTTKKSKGTVAVWQFGTNNFGFKSNEWTGAGSSAKSVPGGTSLLTTDVNMHEILQIGSSLGSDWFPRVIVRSDAERTDLLNNSASGSGAYTAYPFIDFGAYTMIGPYGGCPACIGYDGAGSGASLFADGGIGEGNVVVNPQGLFSDWTEGAPDSFLESAWANDVVRASNPIGWESYAADFYSWAFGYGLTDADWQYMLHPEVK